MRAARLAGWVLVALAAFATPTPTLAGAPPSTVAPVAARRGVIVVALGEQPGRGARALARVVYSDAELRPKLENLDAEILVGEHRELLDRAPADAPATRARELVELRARLAPDADEPATRRLLRALGDEHGAEVVVAVSEGDGRVKARLLRVDTGELSPVEIVGQGAAPAPRAEPEVEGEPNPPPALDSPGEEPASPPPEVTWPGALDAIRSLVVSGRPPPPPKPTLAPVRSTPPPPSADEPRDETDRQWYENPWFWGSVSLVAVVGVTVFVLAVTTEDDVGTVQLGGTVPR
jgi:hypothetical protein